MSIKILEAFDKMISQSSEEPKLEAVEGMEPHLGAQDIGWISPNYTKSRTVSLDPFVLEKNHCITASSDMPGTEAYKVLRQQILLRMGGGKTGTTIMVTSALPGEGKTLTSINLAFTFSRKFEHTVLLVDSDLRRQNVHEVLGFENDKGLADYLLGKCPLSELIVWPRIEKFTVMSGGHTVQESSEILGSPRMKGLVAEMKSRYPERYIIFDTPPLLVGADALTFAQLVDHILVVVEADKTSLDDVKKALSLIPEEKIIGLVLNRSNDGTSEYASQAYAYAKRSQNRRGLQGPQE